MENNTVKTFKINISIILKICSKQKTDMPLHLMNMGFCMLDEKFRVTNHFDKDNGLESNFVTYAFSDNDSIYIGTKKKE